jgi:hypothetical protein
MRWWQQQCPSNDRNGQQQRIGSGDVRGGCSSSANHLHKLLFPANLPTGPPPWKFPSAVAALILLISLHLIVAPVQAIAHDSLTDCSAADVDQKTGESRIRREACEEPSHHVLRLAKRDDRLARQIAQEHGMEVRV